MKKFWLLFLLTGLFLSCARAETLEVAPGGLTLTEAVRQAEAGDLIRIAAGVYSEETETFPIVIDKPLTLTGEDGALLDSPRFRTLVQITSDDVTLRNLRFGVRKWGIVAAQSSRLTLDGCSFYLADEECRTSSAAMWMEAMKSCRILNCDFTGLGICVAGDPLSESSSGKPVLTGLCEVGLDPDYFVTHTIENCTVNGKPLYYFINEKNITVPADAGGLIAAYCDGITVENADVSDSSMGLEIVHSSHVVLRNITADRCGIFGTYVACCEDALMDRVTVRFTNHGIDTRACIRAEVRDCRAEDCDQGIFWSLCSDSLTTGCRVLRCGFGLFAAVGRDNIIRSCSFTDNADGIYLQNEETTAIRDCDITGSTAAGIRVLKSGCTMKDSRIAGCLTGALLFGAHDSVFSDIVFENNTGAGLYLADTRNVTVENCSLSGSARHVETDRALETTVIRNCTLSGTPETGLLTKSDVFPEMSDNTWVE